MKVVEYGSNNKFQDLDFEQIKDIIERNEKLILNINQKNDFLKLTTYLKINDVHNDVLSSTHNALITTKSNIILTFTFYYFENDEDKYCKIKVILSKNYLIIFNKSNNVFDKLLNNVLSDKDIKNYEPAYIFDLILNQIFDYYLDVLSDWDNELALIEAIILEKDVDSLKSGNLAKLKNRIIKLKKNVNQQAEHVEKILQLDHELLKSNLLENVVKNTFYKADEIEKNLEKMNHLIMSIYNLYLTAVSFKQNEVMEVLTLVATIFMPITFITGFFGMNFYMPYLGLKYSWVICTAVMFLITVASFLYFKKKKWFF